MITIKGYTISQSRTNHHIMVVKDNRMVYHAQCDEPLSSEELTQYLRYVIKMVEGGFFEK